MCPLKRSLLSLLLEENNIKTINNDYFKGFKKLRDLYLSANGLLQLPDLQWIGHSLVVFNAGSNDLSSIETFNKVGIFEQIQYIAVDDNSIQSINVSLLHQMPNLKIFNISMNILTYIDDYRTFYCGEILLESNPWHCVAALSWMGEEDVTFELGLTCATPDCLHGRHIVHMSKFHNMMTSSNGKIFRFTGPLCGEY